MQASIIIATKTFLINNLKLEITSSVQKFGSIEQLEANNACYHQFIGSEDLERSTLIQRESTYVLQINLTKFGYCLSIW